MTELERIENLEGQVTALKDLLAVVLDGIPHSGFDAHKVRRGLEGWLARRHLTTGHPPANHFEDAYGKTYTPFFRFTPPQFLKPGPH